MAKYIILTAPEGGVTTGTQLSFRAPCNCLSSGELIGGVTIDGKVYNFCDASGSFIADSKMFSKDALLSVILDVENSRAYLLNPLNNSYTKTLGTSAYAASSTATNVWARVKQLENDMTNKASSTHSHTKSQITDFAHNHDDRYYTEDEIDDKFESYTITKSQITDFPTKVSAFVNDAGYLTSDTAVGTPILDGSGKQVKSLKFNLSGSTLSITTT